MNTPVYDRIGLEYDTQRRADPELARRLASLLDLDTKGCYLDVACGTGNYTIALATEHGGRWDALDVSAHMIGEARGKARGRNVTWHLGAASALPFAPQTFTGIMCTLAIHHFDALDAPFAQIRRVLAEHGRFVLLTATPEQMEDYWLVRYFPEAMRRSCVSMPAFSEVERALHAAGFTDITTEPYAVSPKLEDLFLYAGKHRPHLYLDPRVRQGISTFALLADPEEVARGCAQLARDIDSGEIDRVINGALSPKGDYLFVVAR